MSASFSTNSMGARCGRSFLICSTSRLALSVIFFLLALPGEPGHRIKLTRPFSYRFRGSAAIILPTLEENARTGSGTRAHPGPRAEGRGLARASLARKPHPILQPHASRHAGLARDHAVAADLAVMG